MTLSEPFSPGGFAVVETSPVSRRVLFLVDDESDARDMAFELVQRGIHASIVDTSREPFDPKAKPPAVP